MCMEVSLASVVSAARLTGKPVLGDKIWFASKDGKMGSPSRLFLEEAIRDHLATQAQAARRQAAEKRDSCN